jgi:uncharacterized protein (TIGR00369 family)
MGMVCVDKSEPGRTRWRMSADERFANPAGILQGGFIAAFADSAMAAAAVTYAAGRRVYVANAELKISFFAPVAVGTLLWCEATVVSGGKRVAFVEATVTSTPAPASTPGAPAPASTPGAPGPAWIWPADGKVVARATSTYVLTGRG